MRLLHETHHKIGSKVEYLLVLEAIHKGRPQNLATFRPPLPPSSSGVPNP